MHIRVLFALNCIQLFKQYILGIILLAILANFYCNLTAILLQILGPINILIDEGFIFFLDQKSILKKKINNWTAKNNVNFVIHTPVHFVLHIKVTFAFKVHYSVNFNSRLIIIIIVLLF